MNKVFQHINYLINLSRKNYCKRGKYAFSLSDSEKRFIFKNGWLTSSYYEKIWDLTPRKDRPIGMKSPWIRKLYA